MKHPVHITKIQKLFNLQEQTHSSNGHSSQNNHNPPTRITTNHFEINNGFHVDPNINLADCIENSISSSMKSLKSNRKRSSFNPSFWLSQKFKSRAKRIDVMARIIFPLVFAIFNTSYWTYYLSVQSSE